MQTTRVLIYEQSTFNSRLMADLVECNDMKAVPVDGSDWVDRLETGSDSAAVVVFDLDRPKREGLDVVRRLCALPRAHRPRIVGLVASLKGAAAAVRNLDLEEVIERPLDTGSFARAVCRQALEARRSALTTA
jgi:CheY-like chemotaxis protein